MKPSIRSTSIAPPSYKEKKHTMISAIQWIRKGAAAQNPKKYDLNDEEYSRISKLAADQLEDAKEDLKAAEAMALE